MAPNDELCDVIIIVDNAIKVGTTNISDARGTLFESLINQSKNVMIQALKENGYIFYNSNDQVEGAIFISPHSKPIEWLKGNGEIKRYLFVTKNNRGYHSSVVISNNKNIHKIYHSIIPCNTVCHKTCDIYGNLQGCEFMEGYTISSLLERGHKLYFNDKLWVLMAGF